MDGETNGSQEATQGAQGQAQQQGQGQQETQQQGQSQVGGETPNYERQIAERNEKIASLEAQVAEAAKNAETAEQLRSEIAELKAQGESDRIDFKLQLAGVRNVKAARALLLPCSSTTTTTWTSSGRPSPGSSRLAASTPKAATPAVLARPGFPTRVLPATMARRSSTGARSQDSPTRYAGRTGSPRSTSRATWRRRSSTWPGTWDTRCGRCSSRTGPLSSTTTTAGARRAILQVFEVDTSGYSSASARSWDSIKLLVKKVYIDSSISGVGITNCSYWFSSSSNCTEVSDFESLSDMTSAAQMFSSCSWLETIYATSFSNAGLSGSLMFNGCYRLIGGTDGFVPSNTSGATCAACGRCATRSAPAR